MSSITLDDLVSEAVDVYEKRKNGDKEAAYEQVECKFEKQELICDDEFKQALKTLTERICNTRFPDGLVDKLSSIGCTTWNISPKEIHDAMIRAGYNVTPSPDESHDYHYEPPFGNLDYDYWRPICVASSGATYADMYNAVRAVTPGQVMRYAT